MDKIKIIKKNDEYSSEYQIGDTFEIEGTWYGGVHIIGKTGAPVSLDKDEYIYLDADPENKADSASVIFHPESSVLSPIRCKILLDGGRRRTKIYMVFLREPCRRDRSGSDLFHLWDGFEIKMNLDRNVSCFIFVNALMHDDFFD